MASEKIFQEQKQPIKLTGAGSLGAGGWERSACFRPRRGEAPRFLKHFFVAEKGKRPPGGGLWGAEPEKFQSRTLFGRKIRGLAEDKCRMGWRGVKKCLPKEES